MAGGNSILMGSFPPQAPYRASHLVNGTSHGPATVAQQVQTAIAYENTEASPASPSIL